MDHELPASKVLLVEGASDEHVGRHLCRRHQNMPAFAIIDKKGFLESQGRNRSRNQGFRPDRTWHSGGCERSPNRPLDGDITSG